MEARPLSTTAQSFADYFELTKPGITALMLFTTAAGAWLAASGPPPLDLLLFTLLGTGLATSSAAVFNNLIDRDLDASMERTRARPLPTGRVTPIEAAVFGSALGAAALLILGLRVNPLSTALTLASIAFYVGIYTVWLKRTTPLCTVFGGVPGAIPPVIGWTAVTNDIDAGALVLFALLFLWQPPHFWALALYKLEDYRRSGFPMLPVVYGPEMTRRHILLYAVALLPISLMLYPLGVAGLGYAIAAAVLGLGFVGLALRLRFARDDGSPARVLFLYSITYLGALFTAMLVGCTCY